tara:strand:+ start:144 stop:380 length:237 start_codon:yes stop_codon:yes gene_type:complete
MGIRIKVEVTTPDGCRASWTFSDHEENTTEEALAEALGHAMPALGYCLVPSNEDDTALAFLAGAQIAARVTMPDEVAL